MVNKILRFIYVCIVKRRFKLINQYHKECWVRYGPEHEYTEYWRDRWRQMSIDVIDTLETSFK